jgi:peptidase YpeB-like protein
MHARAINVRTLLIAAAIAMLVLVGAGVANATGSGNDSSEQQATGPGIEKAKSIALDHTNGGRVTGTEIGDEEGYYEVEIIRDDGSQVDVHLDREFNVLSTPADHEGPDSKDAPNDSGG